MNKIADFIFKQIMDDVARCEIEVELRKFFAELPDNKIHKYIDDAKHAFAELSVDKKPSNLNQKDT